MKKSILPIVVYGLLAWGVYATRQLEGPALLPPKVVQDVPPFYLQPLGFPLPDGMIAMRVRVKWDSGQSGDLAALAGMWIELAAPRQAGDPPRRVLERVQVLGVLDLEPPSSVKAVNFALTPDQARKLADAIETRERLTAVLLPGERDVREEWQIGSAAPAGMIAISLECNCYRTAGGFIVPGSPVAIYALPKNPKDDASRIVDHAIILGVDLRRKKEETGMPREIAAFAVTPAQSRKLGDAFEAGLRLQMVLLPPKP